MYRFIIILLFYGCQDPNAQRVYPTEDFFEKIKYEDHKGKILIPVELHGRTFKFIFDTGGLFVVSTKVQEHCHFDTLGTRKINGINGLSRKFNKLDIPEARIESLEFKNFEALLLDLFDKPPGMCIGADGLIGRDFLKDFIVQINGPRKEIIFTNDIKKLNIEGAKRTKLYFNKRRLTTPYLEIKINDRITTKVEFDTGTNKLLSMDSDDAKMLIEKNLFTSEEIITHQGVQSIGASGVVPPSKPSYQFNIKSLEIGDIELRDFYSDPSLVYKGRIGTGLLKYGIVTLDYQKKRFYFQQFENNPQVEKFETLGFGLLYVDGEVIISSLIEGGEAEQKGLFQGAVVTSLSGKSLTDLSEEVACEIFNNLDKSDMSREVTFTTKSDSSVTVVINRQEY